MKREIVNHDNVGNWVKLIGNYPGENIRIVRGYAQQDMICDQSGDQIEIGELCYAVTVYIGKEGTPGPWENEYLTQIEDCAVKSPGQGHSFAGDTKTQKNLINASQAISMLPEGESVHTFRAVGIVLLGGEWNREFLIKAIRASKQIEIGGNNCRKIGHGLVIYTNDKPLYVECKENTDYDECVERFSGETS